ncbi:hypothetical protein TWF102_003216 [Orbilia oligospora]|uniref:LysM domain-containing protein n=1 Tax=Orbilia oligospora TaxID=2813651 RepID=A0A7C8J9T5_ORBOL|nr:hypothetical protein TWF102_003216 [Orbilia oligospora]KAF3082321.1 hypothetical protein TWF103_003358 [Orbilia oligospora]
MPLFSRVVLSLVGSLAYFGATVADAAGVAEIGVVFPRINETYALTDWFPVVFAVQNTQLAENLAFSIYTLVRTGPNLDGGLAGGETIRHLKDVNYTSDPYLVYTYLKIVDEGSYQLFATIILPPSYGLCFSYKVKAGDSCDAIAAEYTLTIDQIKNLNKKTWGWSGCQPLYAEAIICLSTGTPPFPAPIPNVVCGPQKAGSTPPPAGSNIADLNSCPLNACCNIWGQCNVTKDFCVDTNTGPPGTAKPNTYNCISNCCLDVIQRDGNGAMKVAYFQSYEISRKCLYQDALQINISKYTHIHFGFSTLISSYEVQVGDTLSSYQFNEFKHIKNTKKILFFGG